MSPEPGERDPEGGAADFDLEPDEHPANLFLGHEFLAWLWYRVEQSFGRVDLPVLGTVEFWIDDRLVLRGRGEQPQTASFRGGAPSTSQEARAALRAGKAPDEARVGLRLGEREYLFTLRGEGLDLKALKVPQTVKKGEVEAIVYDRMFLFEEATQALEALYEQFLQARLHPSWPTAMRPRMVEWAARGERPAGEPELS